MTKTGFLICFLFIVNKAFAQVVFSSHCTIKYRRNATEKADTLSVQSTRFFHSFPYFTAKDIQSVHWSLVGFISCVPT